jgi:hypothetical protein
VKSCKVAALRVPDSLTRLPGYNDRQRASILPTFTPRLPAGPLERLDARPRVRVLAALAASRARVWRELVWKVRIVDGGVEKPWPGGASLGQSLAGRSSAHLRSLSGEQKKRSTRLDAPLFLHHWYGAAFYP